MKSPREALQRLVAFLDTMEARQCNACLPPELAFFDCHRAQWNKLVRGAREALKTSLS